MIGAFIVAMQARTAVFLILMTLNLSVLLVGCGKSAEQIAVEQALIALKKIDAGTQVGISYLQYGPLVIEAKAKVNEANSKLPDSALKSELNAAIDTYADAGQAWGAMNSPKVARSRIDAHDTAESKYNAPTEVLLSILLKNEDPAVLSFYWKIARQHIDQAASLAATK